MKPLYFQTPLWFFLLYLIKLKVLAFWDVLEISWTLLELHLVVIQPFAQFSLLLLPWNGLNKSLSEHLGCSLLDAYLQAMQLFFRDKMII